MHALDVLVHFKTSMLQCATEVENRGHISDFLTPRPVKIGGRVGESIFRARHRN